MMLARRSSYGKGQYSSMFKHRQTWTVYCLSTKETEPTSSELLSGHDTWYTRQHFFQTVRPTTHLYLIARLRTHGALPPHSIRLENGHNFTFYLPSMYVLKIYIYADGLGSIRTVSLSIIIFSCIYVCVFVFSCLYAHALTIFIKDVRWFNLSNKPRRRRSPDGREFRNKFPYFSESTTENKSFQQLKVCSE
jgi:hypothetical protein